MADNKSEVNISLEEYEALNAAAAPAEEAAPPSKPWWSAPDDLSLIHI